MPLEDVLRKNFHCSGAGNPLWTVYLCLGQAGEGQETVPEQVEVKKEPKSSKSRGKAKGRAAVKREETKEPVAKAEPEDIGRKRSFSDINREYDEELEQVSEELARMEEEERLMENAEDPTLATQEASSGSEEPAEESRGRKKAEPATRGGRGGKRAGAGKGQLEVPSRPLRHKRSRT